MDLKYENRIALQCVQAMIGLLHPNVVGVSFEASRELIEFHFYTTKNSETLSILSDEILTELDVLIDGKTKINSNIHLVSGNLSARDMIGRLLFLSMNEEQLNLIIADRGLG